MTHRDQATLIALAFWLLVAAIVLSRSESPGSVLRSVRGVLAIVAKPIFLLPTARLPHTSSLFRAGSRDWSKHGIGGCRTSFGGDIEAVFA